MTWAGTTVLATNVLGDLWGRHMSQVQRQQKQRQQKQQLQQQRERAAERGEYLGRCDGSIRDLTLDR